MSGNIGQLTSEIDQLVSSLGLEKLSADAGGVGESAGVIADPGTTQPAKQEQGKSNIEAATTGQQSADLTSMQKEEVPGQSTAEAKPSDADNSGAASSTENITTATTVGDDPKVEDGFGSKQQTLDAPSTSHPADVNKDPEKYSEQLIQGCTFIDEEITKLASAQNNTENDTVTVGTRIGEIILGKEASAEDREQAVHETVSEFLTNFAKSASVIGTLTADALDELSKQAESVEDLAAAEGVEDPAAMGGEVIPAEALAEGAAMEDELVDDGDAEAAAIADAATQLAAELGTTPEEILAAAAAEIDGEDMGGEELGGEELGGEGMSPEEEAAMQEEAAAALAGADGENAMAAEEEKIASAELASLREKAARLEQLESEKTEAEKKAEQITLIQSAVAAGIEQGLAKVTSA